MRRLRGLHVEDCFLTFHLVQKVLQPHAHAQHADSRQGFIDLIRNAQTDFIILDGDIPGWPIAQYVQDIKAETAAMKIPLFVYSANPARSLGPLIDLAPKAVLRKSDGPQVLYEAILSHFFTGQFNFFGEEPKTVALS